MLPVVILTIIILLMAYGGRHNRKHVKLLKSANERLANMVMSLDLEIHRLRIAAGEIPPNDVLPLLASPFDDLDGPQSDDMADDTEALREAVSRSLVPITTHPYNEDCEYYYW